MSTYVTDEEERFFKECMGTMKLYELVLEIPFIGDGHDRVLVTRLYAIDDADAQEKAVARAAQRYNHCLNKEKQISVKVCDSVPIHKGEQELP